MIKITVEDERPKNQRILLFSKTDMDCKFLVSFHYIESKENTKKISLPGIVELLLLLSHTPVNLLANLGQLQLGSQHLVLLLLQGTLGLLQGSLQLLLLLLQAPPLFVQVMDGATTISQLVKEVLDLISKVLVLPLDNIKLFSGLIPSCLQTEELTVVVTTFLLAGINLSGQVINLCLPFSNNLNNN